MSKKTQIDILADFIMKHVDGEPSLSEGAGDTAVRIIKQLQVENKQLQAENRRLKKQVDYWQLQAESIQRYG